MSDEKRELQRRIAEQLGWTNLEIRTNWYEDPEVMSYQQDDLYGIRPGERSRDRIPDWPTDLNAAWELHRYRPKGTILLNMSWLELPAHEAAANICRAFMHWTEHAESEATE